MPTYDYRCDTNGRTVEVAHPMSESVRDWGDLCERADIPVGETPPDAPVEKVVSLVAARAATAPEPPGSCGSGCGCYPA